MLAVERLYSRSQCYDFLTTGDLEDLSLPDRMLISFRNQRQKKNRIKKPSLTGQVYCAKDQNKDAQLTQHPTQLFVYANL